MGAIEGTPVIVNAVVNVFLMMSGRRWLLHDSSVGEQVFVILACVLNPACLTIQIVPIAVYNDEVATATMVAPNAELFRAFYQKMAVLQFTLGGFSLSVKKLIALAASALGSWAVNMGVT